MVIASKNVKIVMLRTNRAALPVKTDTLNLNQFVCLLAQWPDIRSKVRCCGCCLKGLFFVVVFEAADVMITCYH